MLITLCTACLNVEKKKINKKYKNKKEIKAHI
jgi:hypothetical protein